MKPTDLTAIYAKRRQRLAEAIGAGVAVVPTAPERVRNRDSHYPYRFDSHFYYLTGFTEPEAVLVLASGKSILFCRESNPEREIWDGFRYGPEAARERFGFEAAHPIGALDSEMEQLLENQPALYYPMGADAEWDARAIRWLNAVRAKVRAGIAAPERVQDVRALIDDMRLHQGRARARRHAARGAHRRRGAPPRHAAHAVPAASSTRSRPSCSTSSAATARSSPPTRRSSRAARTPACCTTSFNDAPLRDGDLLLIDAGCELDGYASDITRTFPVNGRFSAGAARGLRDRARGAARRDRHGARRATPGTSRTTPRSGCWRRA